MRYDFNKIEDKWQSFWKKNKTFKTEIDTKKPKFYVLDMFPYPSGAGLHVGHPLGYIASDIFARYKRLKGFNVLHPMGFDSFGLPAEQYAIQTGQHPSITTKENIERYRQQLESLGFSFDWDREVQTSDPSYYKWTQWIFLKLFNSYYNKTKDKACDINDLISQFEKNGNKDVNAQSSCEIKFSAEEWKVFSEKEKSDILLDYRLTFLADTVVNWCPELGTVLANDEVKDGLSERGGYPVYQKKMRQWMMRITAYADRLESGLEKLDWSDSIKEIQRNWIGKSTGASIRFNVSNSNEHIEVFTTRPDTIFGASFLVLSPEHPLVKIICAEEKKTEVYAYILSTSKRTERERMTEVKSVSGVFTGAYALHPFTSEKLQIWIADYVLAGYGTGAIMAVPSGDQRDWLFAKKFNLPIPQVIEGGDLNEGANESKDGILMNSSFLSGMNVQEAISLIINKLESNGRGKGKVNYKLRDAVFSRQRYWGEPIPIYFENDIPKAIPEDHLPLNLPEVDKYLPTEDGEPPLARANYWRTNDGHPIETNTMPGWAGSSWYFFRYMDSLNSKEPFSKESIDYWGNVDFYVGGAEHATGHLLYARFWTKFLFDLALVNQDEPFQRMLNQGMIQGKSAIIHRFNIGYIDRETQEVKTKETNLYLSKHYAEKLNSGELTPKELEKIIDGIYGDGFAHEHGLKSSIIDSPKPTRIHVDVNLVDGEELAVVHLKQWQPRFKDAIFLHEENEKFITLCEVEKMSKTKFNVINPDNLISKYGADTLRCYEMFLGPVEQHKPWDTKGIEGVHRFLRKFWNLFHDENEKFVVSESPASKEAHKALNKFLKKVSDDIERLSFNTVVSECMILNNILSELKCDSREILSPFVIAISPYSPHIAEELWLKLGNNSSVSESHFPLIDEAYLTDEVVKYPISFNGKVRFTLEVDAKTTKEEIEKIVQSHELSQKWLEGKIPMKVIVVPGKIVNVVL